MEYKLDLLFDRFRQSSQFLAHPPLSDVYLVNRGMGIRSRTFHAESSFSRTRN